MSIEGRIAIDVSFADSATSSGVQSLKKIALVDTTSYTTGKVALLSGTLGTASVQIDFAPTTYRDSSGAFVTFSSVTAMAGKTSRSCTLRDNADFQFGVDADRAFLHPLPVTPPYVQIAPSYTAGTASYTLVLYGT